MSVVWVVRFSVGVEIIGRTFELILALWLSGTSIRSFFLGLTVGDGISAIYIKELKSCHGSFGQNVVG